jgi:hypothetical protein
MSTDVGCDPLRSQAYLYFQYRRWYILSFFLSLALLAVVSKVFYIVRTRRRIVPEPTRFEWAVKETCIHMPFSFYVRSSSTCASTYHG